MRRRSRKRLDPSYRRESALSPRASSAMSAKTAELQPSRAAREVLRPCLTGVAGPLIGNGLFLGHEDVLTKEALVATALIGLERRAALLDAVLGLCQWINISCLRRLSNAAGGGEGE